MDKNQKFLKKLSQTEQKEMIVLLELIFSGKTKDLDIKKLTGYKDIFRVRSGKIRVIFRRLDSDINILEISRRSEKTYRDY
jgi:mRNA-degrading endonuclease RelE of RelBE toxin-antitoxin system